MQRPDSEHEAPPRRRLVRARRGRLVGGVCSGLGEHFSIDPILFRIAFVGLAIFSGLGVGLYLVFILLVPEEGASRAPIRLRRSSWLSIVGVVAILLAVVLAGSAALHAGLGTAWALGLGLGSVALIGAISGALWLRLRRRPGAESRPSADRRLLSCLSFFTAGAAGVVLVAITGAWLAGTDAQLAGWAVVLVGAGLVMSAFAGGARWVLVPALVFAASAAVFAAADVNLHGGVGDRTYHPITLAQVRDGYRLGAGRLEIDLRDVRFTAGDTLLPIRLGVGEVVVLVPRDVCVATDARLGGGYVGALDRQSGGLDVSWVNRPSPAPQTPRLVLDARVGLGALYVADRPIDHGWGWENGGGGFRPGAYGRNEACYRGLGGTR